MLSEAQGFVPILTSEAGSCLTSENWQEVNISIASYYLDSLLLKPGFSLLRQTADLKRYLGWSGALILNAMNLAANKAGIFSITSPYDGSKIKCTYFELTELIKHLKPDAVVLPPKIIKDYPALWSEWPDTIVPFIHADDLQQLQMHRVHGVYFNLDGVASGNQITQLEGWSHIARYITGDINLDLMRQLQNIGVEYIESDTPAKLAMQGLVYNKLGEMDLIDSLTEMQFDTIEADCACPTCSQQLTKAYLHHLLLNTPLLCYRFLIQHNVYSFKK